MAFDPAQYSAMKAANNIVSLTVNDDTITITSKVYSSIDGAPLPNEVDISSISQLNSTIMAFQSVITNYQALIEDAG